MPESLTLGKNDKDQVVFVSRQEHKQPSSVSLSQHDSQVQQPLLLPNGDLNWMCPCLNGMATGPCGIDIREAFSCYHFSKTEPQGKDCVDEFNAMQDCMQKFPLTYRKEDLSPESAAQASGKAKKL